MNEYELDEAAKWHEEQSRILAEQARVNTAELVKLYRAKALAQKYKGNPDEEQKWVDKAKALENEGL